MWIGKLRHVGVAAPARIGVCRVVLILGVIACSVLAQTEDHFPPVLTVLVRDQNAWTLLAIDKKPNEDANGNGILDSNEDANRNGRIDEDIGISSVTLQPGATNVRLNVPVFQPGATSITFTADRISPTQAGSGLVIVTDVRNNVATQLVSLPGLSRSLVNTVDAVPPVCTVLSSNQNSWTIQATDNRPSEDVNGNGILDQNEDKDLDGRIDQDTGVASVVLQSGSTNVHLSLPQTSLPAPSITFTVNRENTGQAGSGTVLVTDVAGNTATQEVNFFGSQIDTVDSFPPVCTVTSRSTTSWALSCTDDRTSEDINGNGVLDAGEDKDGDGHIDHDTGIQSVVLQAGATNVQLNPPAPFNPGATSVQFTVNRINTGQGGSGTVVVTDVAGNTATQQVNFPGSRIDTSDSFPPACTIVTAGQDSWTLLATDNRTSEDTNGNGVLDPGEDKDGDGHIDQDTGIQSVVLQPGDRNVQLNVPPFQPSVPSVTFTVDRVVTGRSGSGIVLVTDMAGNTCTQQVNFPGHRVNRFDSFPPVCTVMTSGTNTWTLKATDNRASEDTNGNGILDPGEDTDGDGRIDEDQGIKSVVLQSGSTNVALNVPTFNPGEGSVTFDVNRVNAGLAGRGTVLVTDVAGNICTQQVNFPGQQVDTVDSFPPVCSVDQISPNSWTLLATDNQPSEDRNGNGVLDAGEDMDGDGHIDKDRGIQSVVLQPGNTNVELRVQSFTPGIGSLQFTVDRVISGQAGTGTVVVTDVAGNTCTQQVNFPGRRVDQFDSFPPVCSVVTSDVNTWILQATDNKPSEDTNGNGQLDNNEDTDGDGHIDKDTGIFSVVLQPGSVNVDLNVPPFNPGIPLLQFTMDRVITGQEGSGTVVVTDGLGNRCTQQVNFPTVGSRVVVDSFRPLCSVLTRSRNSVTGRATDNRRGEDMNRNGRLDLNEDRNGNGRIDKDLGIRSVRLTRGSSNVQLRVGRFSRGASSVNFTVERVNRNRGHGTVLVTDLAGHTCTVQVRFSCPRGRGGRRCRSNGHGFLHSTGRQRGPKHGTLRGFHNP